MNEYLPELRRQGLLARPAWDLFDRMFEDFGLGLARDREWIPSLDVAENEGEYVVTAEIPGLAKEDIDISLSEGLLTIKGEKRQEKKEETDTYHVMERSYGSFSRSLRVPNGVDLAGVKAETADGVLKIVLPKTEEEKTRKIEIN
ncbi:HSP20 family protein [Desulfatibacillum alkenivorans DSM 16219]|jgi:HSP20 family protein|uniref:HSP20 family protein n=1 Tax=Desulfatibacillum alkenivorans DSM 16219 TaxID=1121393 RepID=A0A1M6ECU3_9BACT|nr:Hsp20/alpha crystallin family protein [Desulfatibacillum alkenivorans]SHI83261.1 HSP20 family protein [Desulfatibacillum alkenivorans DSM 16219]